MSVFSMSEEDKKYYQNNASMKDQMQIVGEAFQEMPSVGEAFASAGRGAVDWASGIGPGVRDYVKKVRHLYDDNVVVPAGSKTLLGEDVSTLFEGAREIDCESMSGTGMKEIVGTCWYGTEMMSGNLKSGSPRSLDTFMPAQRAAFEIVLLSKKYANRYEEGKDDANAEAAREYSDLMARYKAACEASRVDWDEVMNYACWEMQMQSAQYRDDSNGIYKPDESEQQRILVNRAHGMIAQCGNEGWEETMLPHVASRIEKEGTYDTSKETRTWFQQIATWLSEKWSSVKEKLGSPWKGMQGMAASLVDTMDTFATYDVLVAREHNEAYKAAADRFVDTIHGTTEKVGDAVGPYVDKVRDAASDKYEQAKEKLGLDDDSGAEEAEAEGPSVAAP